MNVSFRPHGERDFEISTGTGSLINSKLSWTKESDCLTDTAGASFHSELSPLSLCSGRAVDSCASPIHCLWPGWTSGIGLFLAFVPNSSSCYSMRSVSNSRMGRVPLIWCCWPRCGCAVCSPSQLSCPFPLVLLCFPFPRRPFFTWTRPKRED